MAFERSDLAKKIREAREARGLTQAELGARLNPSMSQSGVANWELGFRVPPASALSQLAEVLDIDAGEMLHLAAAARPSDGGAAPVVEGRTGTAKRAPRASGPPEDAPSAVPMPAVT